MKWSEVIDLHARAYRDAADAAERIPADKWRVPRAEGKWTPAEVIEHLTLTYDVFMRELSLGAGMAVKTKWWMQIMLRLTMVPKILAGKGFPPGSRAPREVRPQAPDISQEEAVQRFRDRAAAFDKVVIRTYAMEPKTKLTHAYFGRMKLSDAVLLGVRHMEHHTAQLKS